jgi:DNA invertase Pin-like site-specific DNA recombinase
MIIGYARVSTDDQNLDLQRDALTKAGCQQIFEDRISGSRSDRAGLKQTLSSLSPGDTLVVWRLDRLARSLSDLLMLANKLKDQGVALKSLSEEANTDTAVGTLLFQLLGVLAEFEKNLIKERVNAGLASARARGRCGGRREILNQEQKAHAIALHRDGKTVAEVCKLLGISRRTFYNYLNKQNNVC